MEDIIRKYALQNAVKFNGRANPGTIIGKLMQEDPEIKKQLKSLQPIIQQIVKEVNSLSTEQQLTQLKKLAPELLEEKPKEKREQLKPLENTENVIMRFAPSPSGPLHIGHAYVLSLNYEYVKKYKGEFILRIEDTNPSNIEPEAYNLIPKDAQWLTDNNVKQIIIQSERMELYYEYALRLLDAEHVYICTCEAETFQQLKKKAEECPCRNNTKETNLKQWKKMQTTFHTGEAVARFKTDFKHKNPAMRDFPILRINTVEHPRQGLKYKVWPLMNFSVAIDDLDLNISHTLRGKDHADNAKKQEYIHNALNHKTPTAISVGRINFTSDNEKIAASCSKTRPHIQSNYFTGWDDPRIPFLLAFKRKGYQPEALRKFALAIGVTKNDKSVELKEFLKTINAFNKDILDPISNRHYFINNPIKVTIENAPEQTVELDLHPDSKAGGRPFTTKNSFFIQKEDFADLEDSETCRLIDCLNFTQQGKKLTFHSKTYNDFKKVGKKLIHWLPEEETVQVSVLMDDNETVTGYGERHLAKLEEGDIIQFERFGFCRLEESTDNSYQFIFLHK
jgi:glutamyl-tRNA synthetase